MDETEGGKIVAKALFVVLHTLYSLQNGGVSACVSSTCGATNTFGTSNLIRSEGLRTLGRLLRKTPCRVCTSRWSKLSATAPSFGGSWALPRPSAWPAGHRCAGGQAAFSCCPAYGRATPPTHPHRSAHGSLWPLWWVAFRKPLARPLRVGSAGFAPIKLLADLVRERPWLVVQDLTAPPPGGCLDRGLRPPFRGFAPTTSLRSGLVVATRESGTPAPSFPAALT